MQAPIVNVETPRSAITRSTTLRAVNGRVHWVTSLGVPLHATCSIGITIRCARRKSVRLTLDIIVPFMLQLLLCRYGGGKRHDRLI
jgi:hypothetical protein